MPCPCRAHAMPMPRPCPALTMPFFSTPRHSTAVERQHGHGMVSVNQTRPHCVNQMGKTHSKPLAARRGRGTAWARHAMCEPALNGIWAGRLENRRSIYRWSEIFLLSKASIVTLIQPVLLFPAAISNDVTRRDLIIIIVINCSWFITRWQWMNYELFFNS